MDRIIISTALVLSVTACAGRLSGNSPPAATDSRQANVDLIGRVTNSHGIRDEVNDYIQATFPRDPRRRTAAIALARSNQRVLEVIADNRPVTQDLVTRISYAGRCFAENMDKKTFVKQAREITARSFDTEARFLAHDEFSRRAYGMSVATSDSVDACEAAQ